MAPTSGGFTDLQSYGYLYGCSEQMKGYIRIVDAGFNELHGRGPTLATLKNPIISTVDGISGLFTSIPRPVIKDNLLNYLSIKCRLIPLTYDIIF